MITASIRTGWDIGGKEMRIEFSTAEYKYEHGKAPKGYGYWMFEFEGYEYGAHGTLTEAKKLCREYVKKVAPADYAGTVHVNVLP